jgi:exodeoxyribonuclease III
VKIASWNVNSIRARQERLLAWLAVHQPDVLCLQELKVPDDAFPGNELRGAGYHAAVHGQKTYNGVAILSRTEPEDVRHGFEDGGDDGQARLIAARIAGTWVLSAYVPNGSQVGSDKWSYKLEWLRRLRAHLQDRYDRDQLLCLCGDFNVAPEERDVHDPKLWAASVLFHPEARAALESVTTWGLVDTFRMHHSEAGRYSWWDYRMLAFPRNNGLRIDHIFATAPLARTCVAATIDREQRKGKQPSDHAPVVSEFQLA